MEKLLLRPAEAAELLGLSRSRIYELISSRRLPSVRVGLSRRIPLAALRKWIAEQTEDERGGESDDAAKSGDGA